MTWKDRLVSVATLIAIVAMFLFLWLAIPDYSYGQEWTNKKQMGNYMDLVYGNDRKSTSLPSYDSTPYDRGESYQDYVDGEQRLFRLEQEVERANSWDRIKMED